VRNYETVTHNEKTSVREVTLSYPHCHCLLLKNPGRDGKIFIKNRKEAHLREVYKIMHAWIAKHT